MMPPPPKKPPLEKIKDQEPPLPTEPSKEISTFVSEGDFDKVRYDLEKQKLHLEKQKLHLEEQKLYLRRVISIIAFGIVGLLIILECAVLVYMYSLETSDAGDLIFLAVSPIFAIAAIVVSGLLGVFRANVDDAGKVISGASGGISG